MEHINRLLGNAIAKHRKNIGFSQEELAEKAAIHRTYVSQLERGLKSPTVFTLLQIAHALNITLTALMEEVEKKL